MIKELIKNPIEVELAQIEWAIKSGYDSLDYNTEKEDIFDEKDLEG